MFSQLYLLFPWFIPEMPRGKHTQARAVLETLSLMAGLIQELQGVDGLEKTQIKKMNWGTFQDKRLPSNSTAVHEKGPSEGCICAHGKRVLSPYLQSPFPIAPEKARNVAVSFSSTRSSAPGPWEGGFLSASGAPCNSGSQEVTSNRQPGSAKSQLKVFFPPFGTEAPISLCPSFIDTQPSPVPEPQRGISSLEPIEGKTEALNNEKHHTAS